MGYYFIVITKPVDVYIYNARMKKKMTIDILSSNIVKGAVHKKIKVIYYLLHPYVNTKAELQICAVSVA